MSTTSFLPITARTVKEPASTCNQKLHRSLNTQIVTWVITHVIKQDVTWVITQVVTWSSSKSLHWMLHRSLNGTLHRSPQVIKQDVTLYTAYYMDQHMGHYSSYKGCYPWHYMSYNTGHYMGHYTGHSWSRRGLKICLVQAP